MRRAIVSARNSAGAIQVVCPELWGDQPSDWLLSVGGEGPLPGAQVWIGFEKNDLNYPIYLGEVGTATAHDGNIATLSVPAGETLTVVSTMPLATGSWQIVATVSGAETASMVAGSAQATFMGAPSGVSVLTAIAKVYSSGTVQLQGTAPDGTAPSSITIGYSAGRVGTA